MCTRKRLLAPLTGCLILIQLALAPCLAGLSDDPDPVTTLQCGKSGCTVEAEGDWKGRGAARMHDARDTDAAGRAEAGLLLERGDCDVVLLTGPLSACNDSGDCNELSEAACELLGSQVSELRFNSGSKDPCSARCANGHTVTASCATATKPH